MPNTYNPQVVISAAPGITQYLYLVLFEASAPLTPVANSGQLAPPHSASRQLQFTGLNPVIHLCKLFITDGVSTEGTVIANFSIDPKYPGVELKAPLFIYAGVTNGLDVGTNVFTDPDGELDGWDFDVEIRGFGLLDPDTEVDKTGPGTGYTILLPDYENLDGTLHIIYFQPKTITLNTSTNTGGQLFTESILLTEDTALTGTDYGKMYIIASATSKIAITLPNTDSVPANRLIMFTSGIGSHVNAVISVEGSNSEKIEWLKSQRTDIILGQSEVLWLFKWINPDDSNDVRWKVANASDGIRMVGEKVYYDLKVNANLVNCVFADGTELDRDVYARLWEYVQTLDVDQLVTDAVWGTATGGLYTHKGKYSTGDGSTTFRLPLLYYTGFLRGVDGSTRKAGAYQAEMIGPHTHPSGYQLNDSRGGDQTNTVYNGTDHGGAGSADDIPANSGTENIPANIGQYILIRC